MCSGFKKILADYEGQAEWIREQATKTYTENGAAARNTTGDARLDLFATIGSLRRADPERIELLFAEAYQADPLLHFLYKFLSPAPVSILQNPSLPLLSFVPLFSPDILFWIYGLHSFSFALLFFSE